MFIHITSKRKFRFGIPCLYFLLHCFIITSQPPNVMQQIRGCAPGVLMTRKPCLDGEMEITVGKITVPKGAEIVVGNRPILRGGI